VNSFTVTKTYKVIITLNYIEIVLELKVTEMLDARFLGTF